MLRRRLISWLPAIKYGLIKPFNTSAGKIGSTGSGYILGRHGSSDEITAEIAYEIDVPLASNPQSGSISRTGPVYSMPAPTVTVNPIPIGWISVVRMNQVYIHATGYTGNEVFEVRVMDEDSVSDDLLDTIPVVLSRPAGCFPGALIGPKTPFVAGSLMNPAPGGEVTGPPPGWAPSGETHAEIAYEIGSSSANSPTITVTAMEP